MPHVLVVDDFPGICPVLQQALETLPDCRVSAASSGEEAIPLLGRDRPDLVILDALLPGITGLDLADDASQRGIPVILMTGDGNASEALDDSGWHHLHKPFRIDALLAEVRSVLAQAQQNVAMVQASLQRLRETCDRHHQAFNQLHETLLRSQAARAQRRDRDTPT